MNLPDLPSVNLLGHDALDPFQTAKGLLVAALVGAAVLLLSRRLHSSHVMGFVDWQLLLQFL